MIHPINEEVYQLGIVSRSVPLPKTLGGASVGLLMGRNTTKTDPVLEYTLPGRLGIYRTPFKDRDGCDLTYGGPNRIFSQGTKKEARTESYNHFLGELSRIRGELMDKVMYPEPLAPGVGRTQALQIPVAYPTGAMFCFYPTLLEGDVLEDLGALEYDDPIDDTPLVTAMKSCYKATIPISRLRE